MTDKKLTDGEIVKALEICIMGDCEICSCRCGSVGDCRDALNKKSLDLINRLQSELFKEQNKNKKLRNERNHLKAENENLSHNNKEMTKSILANHKALKQAKAEAYKEFFQLIHKELTDISNGYFDSNDIDACVVMQGAIDKLRETYKEMVGEDNG